MPDSEENKIGAEELARQRDKAQERVWFWRGVSIILFMVLCWVTLQLWGCIPAHYK